MHGFNSQLHRCLDNESRLIKRFDFDFLVLIFFSDVSFFNINRGRQTDDRSFDCENAGCKRERR